MGVRVIFWSDYPLVLSPLKHRGVWGIFELKKWGSQTGSPLNSSIDI